MAFDEITTHLFAVLITSFAYGIAACLFVQSIMTMVRRRRLTGQVSWTLAIPSVAIFIFASVNALGIWAYFYWAILVYPGGPQAYFGLVRTPCKTAYQTGQLGAIMLTDLLMIYRTYILWDSNFYSIVIPCLTFVATFISGVIFVHIEHVLAVTTSIFEPSITRWTISFLLCSFATTVYSTGLIAYRLWNMDRKIRAVGVSTRPSVGYRIAAILVESAAIYSTMHLLYAILYLLKSNVESTPSYLVCYSPHLSPLQLLIDSCRKQALQASPAA
ncbi:hypothetical protein HWV62_41142 [Athelia sp. TMB]|nr:hypothetical protein HWV62_41142 [Athelia sp. TMB]